MSYEPNERYQSADEFRSDLDRVGALGVADLLPGSILDDQYVIEQNLGVGAYGVVYKVQARNTGAVRAIKLLLESTGPARDEIEQRFLQEGKLAEQISHPNIVHVTRHGSWRGHPCIEMDYIEGRLLRTAWGDITWPSLLGILGEIASALDAIHQRGIIHRDLKPENL
jgi:serine/threonine-protein kinase